MKQQVVFIHGGSAFSDYDAFLNYLKTTPLRNLPGKDSSKKWSDTLVDDLGGDFEVFTPSMPNKQNSKYEEWKIWFERHFEYLNDGVILVGWSQGGMFLSKYLSDNETPFKVKALLLLAAPYERFEIEGEDGENFYPDQNKVPELTEKIDNIIVFHSKDDFVVPYEHGEKYVAALPTAEFLSFEDKNHFLLEEFPELTEYLKKLVK